VAGWILELDRGEGIPWKGIIRLGWTKNQAVWHWKKKLQNVEKLRTRVGLGSSGQRTSNETKARLQNYDKLLNEDQNNWMKT
jgi:hypothetical protein